jgi:uncharacterized protein YgiM (DUF1202 family)
MKKTFARLGLVTIVWVTLSACSTLAGTATPTRLSPTVSTPNASETTEDVPFRTVTPLVVAPVVPMTPPECPNAPPTRLVLHERGRVMDDDPRSINVRDGPGTDYEILGSIEVDEVFYVLDGPNCSGGYAWYRVRHNDLEGWLAEGDAVNYYVEPYLPG